MLESLFDKDENKDLLKVLISYKSHNDYIKLTK
jgi:hypothetical protein